MSEREATENQLETFRETFRAGFQEMLMFLEIPPEDFVPNLDEPHQEDGFGRPGAFPLDPLSLGIDEREFDELLPAEKQVIKEVIYQELGITDETKQELKVREYMSQTSRSEPTPSGVMVTVYATNKENYFLHELTLLDGEVRWMLGPDLNISQG
jgi:hypothetical protein